MTNEYALIARLQSINPALDATVALLSAAENDFRPLLEFGFELATHPFGVTLYRGGMGAVVTNPPSMSKVESAVLSLTNTRKPLDTGLGSVMDAAVPLYPSEDALTAYAAACLPDRLRSAAHLDRVHFDVPTDEQELVTVLHEAADKLEAADALLSLSARYREAHAAHTAALTAALQGQCHPLVSAATWRHLEDDHKAADSAMEAAKQALLSAALDIT